MAHALEIRELTASVGEKSILRGLDLAVPFGTVHAIMGPNGSGKSTLCHVLTGKPGYGVSGSAMLDGEELLGKDVDERAALGLLQAFQNPVEIPGVHLADFLREAADEAGVSPDEAEERIARAAAEFKMEPFLQRAVNDELSGGERKRSEILQMAVLRPKVALLDEIDSGLDIDAVRQVAEAVEDMRGPRLGVLMITHYSRILRYLSPDQIHVMIDGRIVTSGGPELADELEAGGYAGFRKRFGLEAEQEAPELRPADFFTETPFDR